MVRRKATIELKNKVYKEYINNGRTEALYYLLQNLTSETWIWKVIKLYVLEKSLVIFLVPLVIMIYTENFMEWEKGT